MYESLRCKSGQDFIQTEYQRYLPLAIKMGMRK
jgi:hypothetical protein